MKHISRILILVLALLLVASGAVSAKNNAAESDPILLRSMCYLGDGSQGRMRLRNQTDSEIKVTWVAEWTGETGKVTVMAKMDALFIVPRKSARPDESKIKITYGYGGTTYSSSVRQNSTPCDSNCTRTDVPVFIDGGWNGIPVKAWVIDTEQPVQYTALDASSRPAVLFSFYPPAGDQWNIRVEPQLPTGLDPARWKFEPATANVTIERCDSYALQFKLTESGAQPQQPQPQQSQPQQQQQPLPEVLPVTGNGGWWQSLLHWLGLVR